MSDVRVSGTERFTALPGAETGTGTGESEGLTNHEHVEHPFDCPVILTGTIKGIRHR